MDKETVEMKIKDIIKNKGITQAFVARQAGIKEADLSLCMNGKRKFKVSEFVNICLLLELKLEDFEGVVA
ncbi:MAG: helix-turn-helix transcriptional regulator [Bacteroidales bacterium]|nr:helix-turn-helix transcriptional regulator [Bacteroidales bacterium]